MFALLVQIEQNSLEFYFNFFIKKPYTDESWHTPCDFSRTLGSEPLLYGVGHIMF